VSELRTPDRRECLRCGRTERWDPDDGTWTVATVDGERTVGGVHCIHEWDVTGSFEPVEEDS